MTFEVQLREILTQDEGRVGEIYLCSESVPTFGIGHAVKLEDPEYGLPVGTAISDARIDAAFASDMQRCLSDARWLVPKFDDLPDDARITIASLAYQLGMPRYNRFKRHLAALNADEIDWQAAADELRDSKLYRQTPARTERHAKRLEQLAV